MNSLLRYYILEYKKSIKIFIKSILGMVLMLIFLILGVAAVSFILLQSQVFDKVQVAVVIPESEKEVKLAASYISAMESVENICEFLYMNETEAVQSMQEGEVQAIMTFPDNFFEEVYVGENPPATIYFSDESAHNTQIFQGLLDAGVSLLQISEAGVYATLYVSHEYSPMLEGGELGDYMAGLYVKQILQKDKVFTKNVVSAMGTLSYEEYYFSAAFLVLLLMTGLHFSHLYEKKNKAVEQKLRLYGIGYWQITGIRVFIMTSILWMLSVLFYFFTYILDKFLGNGLIDFNVKTLCGFLLLCASVAAFFHVIYMLSNDGIQGAVIVLSLNMIMLIGSGVIIPMAYFPAVVAGIGKWLPVSVWNGYQAGLMFGALSFAEVMGTTVIGIASVGIGALIYEKKYHMV